MCNRAVDVPKRVKCLTLCSQRFIELLTGAAPHSFGSSDARQPCCVLAGVGAGIGPRRKTELWQHARACPEKKGSPQHQLDRLCSQPMCFRIKFKSPGLLMFYTQMDPIGLEQKTFASPGNIQNAVTRVPSLWEGRKYLG